MQNYNQIIEGYEVRKVIHQGKPHIVVPVTMMVEGVHDGSHGPIFHSIAELGKFTGAWDGRPVVIRHPKINGMSVSANIPILIDSEMVGRVFNTHVDGNKLRQRFGLMKINYSRFL